jgi:nucleoside-diphosphate-sugar epimerase
VKLFVFGLGYSALHFARERRDLEIGGTVRSPEAAEGLRADGFEAFAFDGASADSELKAAIRAAEAVMVSIPPAGDWDPALDAFEAELAAAPRLQRVLYLSTVGVYGGADGAWVDETAPLNGASSRARARIAAEERWRALGARRQTPVDVLRLAGIYGPQRNALAKIREGTARRIVKSGQIFNRIHVADISGVLSALLAGGGEGGIWNVADLEPAPPQDVVAFAADLLGVPPPPEEPFETAEMTSMARSFYSDNRRVAVGKLKETLGYAWRYPTYREGLRALTEGFRS